jgi:ABC-type uncharacterized transport system substrate-binding protein
MIKKHRILVYRTLAIVGRYVLCLGLLLSSSLCFAEPEMPQFRVGVFQIGTYWTSTLVVSALKIELKKEGWLKRVDFVKDADCRPDLDVEDHELESLAEELMARKDLDLIIVIGTRATRALLLKNNLRTPILGLDITDPVKAKLVKSVSDSGVKNFTTIIQERLWTDMFHLFHQTVKFNRLGIVMTDSLDGQIFSNLDAVREVARDRGFNTEIFNDLDEDASSEECQHAIDVLISKDIDAFVLPIMRCFDIKNVSVILKRLNAEKIATFASEGSLLVKAGALMGVSTQNIDVIGRLSADMMIKILQGASPGDLPMLQMIPPSIALNIETAEKIGVNFSFQMLSVADEIILKSDMSGSRQ